MYDTANVVILFARHILALFWAIIQVYTASNIQVIKAFTAVSYFGSHGYDLYNQGLQLVASFLFK